MAERTPPTAAIKQAWIEAHPFRATTTVEGRGAEFDRWLAAHDAELRAEVERLREVSAAQPYETERELAVALDEARQQLADLRARCSECGPGYRVGDEGCRHRPAPVVPDSADVRERVWQALRESRRTGLGGMTETQALDHMTDAVLAAVRPTGQEGL